MLFNWHQPQWQLLQQQKQQQRFPQALLLSGSTGLGKFEFSQALSRHLLCGQMSLMPESCGQCHNCHLLVAGNHPDYRVLQATEDSKTIKVDVIRELPDFVHQMPQCAQHRIIIIEPAEAMNTAAANALLKILEEPPASAILMLITHQAMMLPATIRSRCQKIIFNPPTSDLAKQWLQQELLDYPHIDSLLAIAENRPLAALALAKSQDLENREQLFTELHQLALGKQNSVKIAERWTKTDIMLTLHWITSWVTDLIRFKSTALPSVVVNQNVVPFLQELKDKVDFVALFEYLDKIYEIKKQLQNKINRNTQLVLDEVLIGWCELFEESLC